MIPERIGSGFAVLDFVFLFLGNSFVSVRKRDILVAKINPPFTISQLSPLS